jgi:hypothetical protein
MDPTAVGGDPGRLRYLFTGEALTVEIGELIGRWVAGREAINPEDEWLRKAAYDEAAKGYNALRQWYNRQIDQQRYVLRQIAGNLRSAARTADDEAAQERLAKEEQQRSAGTVVQPFRDPFVQGDDGVADGINDPFGYLDLRGDQERIVPISPYPDGSPAWEDTVADMLRVIDSLTDDDDTALKQANRDTLDQMRQADRDAWNTLEHRGGAMAGVDREVLGERDRALRPPARAGYSAFTGRECDG